MTDFIDGAPLDGPGGPFYLTFFNRHLNANPPDWQDPEGWVTILAPSYRAARAIVVDLFGRQWSELYDETDFVLRARLFPRGELLCIIVPAGLVEEENHRD